MKFNFSHEPILWLGAIIIVLQTVVDMLDGGDFQISSWLSKLGIAVGAVVGRQLVTPTAKINEQPPV
jgi:hypothetical protein